MKTTQTILIAISLVFFAACGGVDQAPTGQLGTGLTWDNGDAVTQSDLTDAVKDFAKHVDGTDAATDRMRDVVASMSDQLRSDVALTDAADKVGDRVLDMIVKDIRDHRDGKAVDYISDEFDGLRDRVLDKLRERDSIGDHAAALGDGTDGAGQDGAGDGAKDGAGDGAGSDASDAEPYVCDDDPNTDDCAEESDKHRARDARGDLVDRIADRVTDAA